MGPYGPNKAHDTNPEPHLQPSPYDKGRSKPFTLGAMKQKYPSIAQQVAPGQYVVQKTMQTAQAIALQKQQGQPQQQTVQENTMNTQIQDDQLNSDDSQLVQLPDSSLSTDKQTLSEKQEATKKSEKMKKEKNGKTKAAEDSGSDSSSDSSDSESDEEEK